MYLCMQYVAGDILTLGGFKEGYVGYTNKGINIIEQGTSPESPVCQGYIVPPFVNSHIHVGDAFIRQQHKLIPHDLQTTVEPPDGLKHQWLAQASSNEIITGMQWTIQEMKRHHINWFCDFREGGIAGVSLLSQALQSNQINSVILGRPTGLSYHKKEIENLLYQTAGIGISSISNWDYSELEKLARFVHYKKKLFALHASEGIHEDIDLILNLHPDFLVHMNQATAADLEQVAAENIPIVLCPRSNHYFGLQPNYQLLKHTTITLLLGTDNTMIVSPDMLAEIRFIQSQTNLFSIEELLNMITYQPRKALNLDDFIPALNFPRSCIVLDYQSLEPLMEI
ncbi:MAG: amidohydrolase family protein [Candidatus Thermoplasmatota archaeon]|nr:amidohydrolase family protein [Candidatus Thermoplasmatota archaeon]MBU1941525.1 amidohydrolase family protein [Candidatus Thermoplasmatota archaeon]